MSAVQGLTQYTPTMIKSLGFSAVDANALASVPVYCFMVILVILSYLRYALSDILVFTQNNIFLMRNYSDKLGHRGPAVLLGATWNVITYACFRGTSVTSPKWHRYGVIVAADLFYAGVQ
jgi:hypothetical protein